MDFWFWDQLVFVYFYGIEVKLFVFREHLSQLVFFNTFTQHRLLVRYHTLCCCIEVLIASIAHE